MHKKSHIWIQDDHLKAYKQIFAFFQHCNHKEMGEKQKKKKKERERGKKRKKKGHENNENNLHLIKAILIADSQISKNSFGPTEK